MADFNTNFSAFPQQTQSRIYNTMNVKATPDFTPNQALATAQQNNIPVVVHHDGNPQKEIIMPNGDAFIIKGSANN